MADQSTPQHVPTHHETYPAAMTRTRAADYLGVTPSFLDRLKRRGDLDPILVGGTIRGTRYLKADLDEYIANCKRSSEIA